MQQQQRERGVKASYPSQFITTVARAAREREREKREIKMLSCLKLFCCHKYHKKEEE
jgi:hypothetical protein